MGAHVLAQCLSYHEVRPVVLLLCDVILIMVVPAFVHAVQMDGSQSKGYSMA